MRASTAWLASSSSFAWVKWPPRAPLAVTRLGGQFQASTDLAATGRLGIAGGLDLQQAIAVQADLACGRLPAADTGAFEQQVAAAFEDDVAFGVDLRDVGVTRLALLALAVKIATPLKACAAGAIAALEPGVAGELERLLGCAVGGGGKVKLPVLWALKAPLPASTRVPS